MGFRMKSVSAFGIGLVLAASILLAAPPAAASGWTQVDYGSATNPGTWSQTSSGIQYTVSGTGTTGAAYVYSASASEAGFTMGDTAGSNSEWMGLTNASGGVLAWRLLTNGTGIQFGYGSNYGYTWTYEESLTPSQGLVQGDQVVLSWDASSLVEALKIYDSGGGLLQTLTLTVPSGDVPSGTLYPYAGANEPATLGTSSIAPLPLVAPSGLTASSTPSGVSLSWQAESQATSYTLLRAAEQAGPYSTLASAIAGTNYTDAAVSDGTTYWYELEACNAGGCSAPSAAVSATPNIPPPPAPTGFVLYPHDGSVDAAWTADPGATSYTLLRALSQTGPFATMQSGITLLQATDGTVTNGVMYWYELEACNAGGCGTATAALPAEPTDPTTGVVGAFAFPSLADAGLWAAIGTLWSDFWEAVILAAALTLFAGFGGGLVSLIARAADRVRGL